MASYSMRPSDAPILTGSGTSAQPFKFNLTEDLQGYISRDGKILSPNYILASDYSENVASVELPNKKMGVIDKAGNWIIQPTYEWIGDFHNGFAVFKKNKEDQYGYLDLKGNVAIKPQYDIAESFSEGRALVCRGLGDAEKDKCAYIKTDGNPITDYLYSSFYSEQFSEGLSMVCSAGIQKNSKCGYIDLNGNIKLSISAEMFQDSYGSYTPFLSSFYSGVARVGGRWFDNIQKWGFIGKDFKYVIPNTITKEISAHQDDPWEFSGNLQWQTQGTTKDHPGKSAAIDKKGNIKFFSTYDEVSPFSQGLSAVKVGTKWGYINEKNQMVIKPQFQDAREFSEGLAEVRLNGKWGFIN
jgi:hypothetical protein